MDWFLFIGSSRREYVSWTPEARGLFTQIANEVSSSPRVRVALHLKRPVIFFGRQLAAAGHNDGIAVRLAGERRDSALRIPGCQLLTRRDGLPVRGMVGVPWSAHEHWRDLIRESLTP
jgi:hypothetical protein